MAKDPLIDPWKRYDGHDFRRSSRVKCDVPLLVYGQDSHGEKFVEKTQAIDLNLHGCGFLSRHACQPGSYVTLRFGGERYDGKDKVVRAQVKRSDVQPDSRRMLRIGVELGIPGNVWSYSPIPLDWRRLLGPNGSQEPTPVAAPVLVTRPKPTPPPPVAPDPAVDFESSSPVEIQLDLAPAPSSPVPAVPIALPPSSAPPPVAPPPSPRVADASDSAILTAIEKLLEPAIARALSTLDLQTRASMRQLRETASQRPAGSAGPIRPELDALLDERLADIRSHWDVQLDGYLVRMEECVQRMERHAAQAEQKLVAAEDTVDKALLSFSRQLEEQVNYAVKRASQVIAQKAALSVDHQLLRLTEDAHFVAREVNAMVESDSAAARAELEKVLHSLLEELRTRSEEQAKLLASDTRHKVTSALAALEAEHLALCESRMKSMGSEISQAGSKVTAEFRQGLRAFFYSCLVAAVGAVEEHSKTTLGGLTPDALTAQSDQPPLPKP